MYLNFDNLNRYLPKSPSGKRIFVGKNVDVESFKRDFFATVFKE